MIITSPPENYKETKLYKALLEKSKADDGLAEKTTTFIQNVRPLQELIISGPFKDYTLHNPNHSKKLLHLAEYIIPEETLKELSALELSILILSFYLHDLGMVVTQTERERIVQSSDFIEYLQIKTEFSDKLARLRENLKTETIEVEKIKIETTIFQIMEAALAEYLRPLHATKERYEQLIKIINSASGRKDLLSISGASFEKELIEVCISHNLNSSALIENFGIHEERFPRDLIINGFSVNLQYCSAILRIVDILDFDKERTPQSLFNSLGIRNKSLPGFEISLKEWNKHLAINTISITTDEIVISGDSNHPTIEHSIKEFCKIIEGEIKDTQTILKLNKSEILEKYKIALPLIVRANIRSLDYIYKDYSIKLNETAIVNLLMGENLYANANASIRELIQNSIDACDLRAKIETSSYKPLIEISSYKDDDSRNWIKIIDNGIGMDEYVLSNFFFKVGNSYYSSPDFKRLSVKNQIENFVPISRFGIGLLSIFMIGEAIKVTTKNSFSSRRDFLERTLLIDSVDSLAVVTEKLTGTHGTTIEVLLRKDKSDDAFIQKLFQYTKDTIIRPKIPITISDGTNTVTNIIPDNYVNLKPKIKKDLDNASIEVVQIDFERFSNFLKGKAIFFFFKNEDGTLSYYDKREKIVWGYDILKTSLLFEGFLGGSRVTVNGISMGFKRIGSLYNSKKRIVSNIFDIEVSGINTVLYNVARQKIYNNGLQSVRKEILKSVEKGFKEIGVSDRFDEETINHFEKTSANSFVEKLSDDIIVKINKILPPTDYPYDESTYINIGKELNVNKYAAKKFVASMHFQGKIIK